METIKLQKYFSDCGIMSRRAAEVEIENGRVTVNGAVAYLGMRIDPETDVIIYKGRKVVPPDRAKTYILLNKPRQIITSLSDELNRPTVLNFVKDVGVRVYPVGRLDFDSDGLLLFTDDGELTYQLTHPKHQIPKIYHVCVTGEVNEETLKKLSSALVIDGYQIQPVKVEVVTKNKSMTTLKMTLYEGRNRQIRKMCELCKLKVLVLTRVAIGKIELNGLRSGEWRHLTPEEVEYLKSESNKNTQ